MDQQFATGYKRKIECGTQFLGFRWLHRQLDSRISCKEYKLSGCIVRACPETHLRALSASSNSVRRRRSISDCRRSSPAASKPLGTYTGSPTAMTIFDSGQGITKRSHLIFQACEAA